MRELHIHRPLNDFPHLRNLTSLSFLAYSAAETLRVLRECPLLEALSITVHGVRRCLEEITLPFLRTLELGSYDTNRGLPKLTVPRLEQISFVDLAQECIPRIKDLLARSSCKLNSIKLTCNELAPSQSLADVLPNLPLAQELTLSYDAWAIEDLRLLRHCQAALSTVTRLNFEGYLELGDIDSGKFRSTLQSWAGSGDRDASKRVVLRLGDSFVARGTGLVEELTKIEGLSVASEYLSGTKDP
uniref:F-box domain-containing protein n=1 Tax=Mycena chlorophos TaxID=658473 RepID=A0ABQ0L1T8_MYCCL|nr:predicted protein [Mycena chlorophos]